MLKHHMDRNGLSPREQRCLLAIRLVECHQRGLLFRAAEWVASWLRLKRGATLGPFQIRHSPFDLNRMLVSATEILRSAGIESWICSEIPREIAVAWNGSCGGDTGTDLSYAEAIRIALDML